MDIEMQPYDPSRHAADRVAELIFEADPALTSLIMGEREEAVERFKLLLGISSSPWSAERTLVALLDEEVVGVLVGAMGDEKAEADRKAAEWGRAMGLRWLLKSIRVGMKMAKAVTNDVADDEYYPLALTVSAEHRGKGIGSQMMEWILQNHDRVVIDVNIDKQDAVRFYQRHGFEIVGENTIVHKGKRIGNYSMRNKTS